MCLFIYFICIHIYIVLPSALEANKLVPRVVGGAAALVLLVAALSGTCILCARHHRGKGSRI